MRKYSRPPAPVLFAGLAMAVFLVGCGGPYYTMDGAMGTKIITIHDGETKIKVPVETAGGGSLSGSAVNPDGTFKLEKDDYTVSGKVVAGRVAIEDVKYKDQKLKLGNLSGI